MRIETGSRVSLHFSLRLADGMVAESSFDDEPLTFVLGDGSLDQALEYALLGLKPGDRQVLTLDPGQAFGSRDAEAIQWLATDQFPQGMQLDIGEVIGFSDPEGVEVAGIILEHDGQRVKVDFNHPLAGREIEFEVEILSVEQTTGTD